ncbi:DNA polymerase III subunit epsilon [Moraxella macacae 0408225]|uniref:DNA polymerase III subunit epsilon n=2 Tax=Moraxella macacae TaxID=765840 RepID=L2F769_9GAMM|nr:DNA polymerase III subunit epsilon [Moraxella macacae 0408225]
MDFLPIFAILAFFNKNWQSMTQHSLQSLPNQVIAYTDGACRGNGKANNAKGGFGAVVIFPNGEQLDICGGEVGTTNNRMELLGVIMALENSPANLPIQIYSDSSYVIKGITQWITGWKSKNWAKVKNVDLWQRLDLACQQRQIDWQWVKGHAGHTGNEYADQLANQGIDNLPYTNFNKTLKNMTTNTTYPPNTVQDFDNFDNLNHAPNFDELPDSCYQEQFYEHNSQPDLDDHDGDFLLNMLDDDSSTSNPTNQTTNKTPPTDNLTTHDEATKQTTKQKADKPKSEKNCDNGVVFTKPATLAEHFYPFVNNKGAFIAQDESLIAQRPEFDGNTKTQNLSFIPLLPIAKHQNAANRQLVLDTETTGFDAQGDDRIVEIGVVELINRKPTGEKLHVYINPLRDMDEEVIRVHGIHSEFLAQMPTFAQVGKSVYDFLQGAELIAHNANFDVSFLQAEFARIGLADFEQTISVVDSLAIAKQMYAGQRNTLDALVKRLDVGKKDRTFHGALLDAEILAEVYLAMTGGQVSLGIDDGDMGIGGRYEHRRFDGYTVGRFVANAQNNNAHLDWLHALKDKHPALAEKWQNADG